MVIVPFMLVMVPASRLPGSEHVSRQWEAASGIVPLSTASNSDPHDWLEIGCTINSIRRVPSVELSVPGL